MKRFLSLALALVLVLSLFSGLSFAEEKRVLRFASVKDYAEEYTYDVFQEIATALNCEFQHDYYDKDSFYAILGNGGGDYDIFQCNNDIPTILDSDMALNLDPYIDEYAPNMRKNQIAGSLELSRQLQSKDGGLYLLPPVVGFHNSTWGAEQSRGYVLRWDYYKELGCPEIDSDDDYINVLIQMLENHPVNENGKPNLLFGGRDGFGEKCLGNVASWSKEVSSNLWCQYQYKNNIFSNEVYDGYLDVEHSDFWNSVKFLNKIYRLGYFDEDCFTMTGDEYDAKIAEGRYMGLVRQSENLYNEAKKADPNTISGYLVIPSKNKTYYSNIDMVMGNMPGDFFFINKNTKNIDLALGYFNYIYDPDWNRYLMCGTQGVHWDYDENGVPKMFEEAYAARVAKEDHFWATSNEGDGGHGKRYSALQGYNPAMLCDDGYPVDLSLNMEDAMKGQNHLKADFAQTYGYQFYQEVFVANGYADFRNDLGECISACVTSVSNDDKRILADCDSILASGLATMIMSESDEEYEANKAEILAEIEATGEAECFQRYKAEWDKVKDVMMAIHITNSENNGMELYPLTGPVAE